MILTLSSTNQEAAFSRVFRRIALAGVQKPSLSYSFFCLVMIFVFCACFKSVLISFDPRKCCFIVGMSQQQQQHQDPVSGFPCGAATPQSPLLSPRMGQGQSPMLQQNQAQPQGPNQGAPPGYQASTDHNGWPQAANISTSNR